MVIHNFLLKNFLEFVIHDYYEQPWKKTRDGDVPKINKRENGQELCMPFAVYITKKAIKGPNIKLWGHFRSKK